MLVWKDVRAFENLVNQECRETEELCEEYKDMFENLVNQECRETNKGHSTGYSLFENLVNQECRETSHKLQAH